MDRKNNSGGNGFNIFIVGIIFGVLATLLLTTKKGRKLLKVIIDEGSERVSKWEDVVDTLKAQIGEGDEGDESTIGEEVAEASTRHTPRRIDKIELESLTEADVEDQSVTSELPEENEIKSKEDYKKKTETKIEEALEPAPKKKSHFFKGTRKKTA